MNKALIGWLFIAAGAAYGSFAFDFVSSRTFGPLIKSGFINQPSEKQLPFGPKPTIIFYGITLIIIGIYILWSPSN